MIIDYSTFRPTMQQLKDFGVTAVGRYIGWNSVPNHGDRKHNIDKAEADTLTGNEISVFLCFEYAAEEATGGSPQGTQDGELATEQLTALGAPNGMTVYFALDFDIPDYAPNSTDPKAKLGPVAGYFESINALKPRYKVGVYGGYYAVSRVMEAGLAEMGWQTVAWSGGQVYGGAVLLQPATTMWNTNADVDLLLHGAADFGQWPRPQEQQPERFVADGTSSLQHAAQRRGLAVSKVLWLTAQRRPDGYGPMETTYFDAGRWDAAMPVGMVYWA